MKTLLNVLVLILATLHLESYSQQSFYDITPGDGNGLRFWQGDWYKIHMGNSSEYHYGPVTDYSIKMNMSSEAGRGWTWGIMGQTPVAGISTQGQMQIASTFTAGGDINVGLDGSSISGYGTRLSLLGGSNNSDLLWLSRYNHASNSSDLRVNIGDDNMGDDALDIGMTFHGDQQWVSLMKVSNNGNVGVGTTSPNEKLHVKGGLFKVSHSSWDAINIRLDAQNSDPVIRFSRWLGDANGQMYHNAFVGQFYNGAGIYCLGIGTGVSNSGDANAGSNPITSPSIVIPVNGNVGIGTTDPDERLTVKGTIHTHEVRVDTEPEVVPDYVFEEGYQLTPLPEVESYIKANKHLPEVPSAKEMEENGLNLKEMNLALLKKVEELTLHVIRQQKEIEQLKQKIQ